MRLHYYAETDSLYIDLAATSIADSQESSDGLVADYDEHASSSGTTLSTRRSAWTFRRLWLTICH